MKRNGTSNLHYKARIPADVKPRAVGTKLYIQVGGDVSVLAITAKTDFVRVSLKTPDPRVARLRAASVAVYLQNLWQALRSDETISLTHQQATALAGELYASWANPDGKTWAVEWDAEKQAMVPTTYMVGMDDPGIWDRVSAFIEGQDDDGEGAMAPLVKRLLMGKGVGQKIDEGSRELVTSSFVKAMRAAMGNQAKVAQGDYSPNPEAAKFPKWRPPGKAAVPLMGLLEDWWTEARQAGKALGTYEAYRTSFNRLLEFMGHDDASKITPASIIAFKDHRLANGISAVTIGTADFAAFNSVFGWAVANLRLPSNPAKGIKVQRPRKQQVREKGLEPEEAAAILRHASAVKRSIVKPNSRTHLAKRWVPWLCAYTGARVGEMAQLRKQDVKEVRGVWTITITPEAGTVKTGKARSVVIHEHLVAIGFLDFVEAQDHGYLFLPPTNDMRRVWASTKTRLAEFAREVVKDPNVAPNHGWRHAFKTVGREAGIEDSTLDAICGHAPNTAGGQYGSVSLATQADAMGRFPRFIQGNS